MAVGAHRREVLLEVLHAECLERSHRLVVDMCRARTGHRHPAAVDDGDPETLQLQEAPERQTCCPATDYGDIDIDIAVDRAVHIALGSSQLRLNLW